MSTKLHLYICRRDEFWQIRNFAHPHFLGRTLLATAKQLARAYIAAEGPNTLQFVHSFGKYLSKQWMKTEKEWEEETSELQVFEIDEDHLALRLLSFQRYYLEELVEEHGLPLFVINYFDNVDHTEDEERWYRGWQQWLDVKIHTREYMVCPLVHDLDLLEMSIDYEWVDIVRCARQSLLYQDSRMEDENGTNSSANSSLGEEG